LFFLPAPNRFAGNIDVAFGQQVFDTPEVQGKTEIQPDRMLYDLRWKPMSGVGNFVHPRIVMRPLSSVTHLP
jgi:hypothetical protein